MTLSRGDVVTVATGTISQSNQPVPSTGTVYPVAPPMFYLEGSMPGGCKRWWLLPISAIRTVNGKVA